MIDYSETRATGQDDSGTGTEERGESEQEEAMSTASYRPTDFERRVLQVMLEHDPRQTGMSPAEIAKYVWKRLDHRSGRTGQNQAMGAQLHRIQRLGLVVVRQHGFGNLWFLADVATQYMETKIVTPEYLREEIKVGHETVRGACQKRKALDGADAQALEYALTLTENERDTHKQHRLYYQHMVNEIIEIIDTVTEGKTKVDSGHPGKPIDDLQRTLKILLQFRVR